MSESTRPEPFRRNLLFSLLALSLTLIGVSGFFILRNIAPFDVPATVPVPVDFPAPELTLSDTQGVFHSLTDYRGQIVLVNLWATWCEPCKKEMPTLQAFYRKYEQEGFVIVAINDGEPSAEVLQFAADYRLTFPIWLDPTSIATQQAFKTLNLPTSFVIARDGTTRLMWLGGISRRMLEKYVAPLIMETQ